MTLNVEKSFIRFKKLLNLSKYISHYFNYEVNVKHMSHFIFMLFINKTKHNKNVVTTSFGRICKISS